jgi:hypothetical protein
MPRRDFLQGLGATAAGMAFGSRRFLSAVSGAEVGSLQKGIATVRGAFLYPSTESLKKEGYYSWPGAGFDAEGRQKEYMNRIEAISRKLAMRIVISEKPLRDEASVGSFINEVKQQPPDGLLLIPFKKSEWTPVNRIFKETGIPTVILATLGILLNPQINELHRQPGVYLISSLDNFDAVEYGMRMIKTARWMKESRLISLAEQEARLTTVPGLGVQVVKLPRRRFADEFSRIDTTDAVRDIARTYSKNAQKVVEPSEADVVDSAKTYLACKQVLQAEQGDAIMMDCLGGIRQGVFPPPCMGFMSLRDEGIAAGCQNDLEATLTMMLVQQLFERPGFQQNASVETENNNYFGAHCTCPTKLGGRSASGEPYILRNHAESGVGVAPQVLWPQNQDVTIAHYLTGEEPQMIVYSGKVVRCYDTPPAGGCRTNVEIAVNEVADACDVKGMHQTIFYGNHARRLREFCQLFGIKSIS